MSKYSRGNSQVKPLSVLSAQIEAMLFLAASPVSESELKTVLGVSGQELNAALKELENHLASGHGLVMKSAADGWVLEIGRAHV